jgi:signal transduction histidine kinase
MLGNVHRHSSSPTATVSFHVDGDKAYLEVKDKGKRSESSANRRSPWVEDALDSEACASGFPGRGELHITSNSEGTFIRVAVPIEEAAAA